MKKSLIEQIKTFKMPTILAKHVPASLYCIPLMFFARGIDKLLLSYIITIIIAVSWELFQKYARKGNNNKTQMILGALTLVIVPTALYFAFKY